MAGEYYDFAPTNPQTKIRVKYLDRSDIESLGWKVIKEPYRWQFKDSSGRYKLITAIYTEKDGSFDPLEHIAIFDNRNGGEYPIFYGYIKNKTEFKKLLKQLDV